MNRLVLMLLFAPGSIGRDSFCLKRTFGFGVALLLSIQCEVTMNKEVAKQNEQVKKTLSSMREKENRKVRLSRRPIFWRKRSESVPLLDLRNPNQN